MIVAFLGLTVYSVMWLRSPFDPQGFAMGSASILSAIGGGQGVRDWLRNRIEDPDVRF